MFNLSPLAAHLHRSLKSLRFVTKVWYQIVSLRIWPLIISKVNNCKGNTGFWMMNRACITHYPFNGKFFNGKFTKEFPASILLSWLLHFSSALNVKPPSVRFNPNILIRCSKGYLDKHLLALNCLKLEFTFLLNGLYIEPWTPVFIFVAWC